MSNDFETPSPDAIAIVGLAGRFPGAADIAAFWRNLAGGVESVRRFSREELAARGVPAARLDDPLYVPASAVLDGVEWFDAEFFGFTPREADITDPQHRVFLECAWEALEDSGHDPDEYAGRIGVYAGAGLSTYLLNNLLPNPEVVRSAGALPLQLGNNKDYVPLRTSYKLNLRGPSVNVNTACSSSLVAVHLACQSLLSGECDMALAGGVGIQVPQEVGYTYAPNGILSPDGHCRAFDAQAEGTVSGNGAGIVVLKRLADALADGDTIRAVILGSAINNDGAAKVGFTAPSVEGQAAVIGEALAVADVEPDSLGYIEAHGTGTALGDPIEFTALNSVFRARTDRAGFCGLGSVKTNLGHLDEAAGVAGLIKTVLALQHGAIPPSLHFERPNPEIDLARSPFFVPTRLTPWPTSDAPRRAGVSSFGIGGTNAHLVLEAAPAVAPAADPARPWQLLLLSARTPTALDALAGRLAAHFRAHPDLNLADAAYTLHVGRKAFAHRRAVLCRTLDEAATALACGTDCRSDFSPTPAPDCRSDFSPTSAAQGRAEARPTSSSHRAGCRAEARPTPSSHRAECRAEARPTPSSHRAGCRAEARPTPSSHRAECRAEARPTATTGALTVAFLFPGQGSQHVGMALGLYQTEPLFRETLDRAAEWLRPELGFDLRDALYPATDAEKPDATARLTQTAVAQPALFTVEYALARLLMDWGVSPKAMLGHSIGEYVAACVAGVFSFEDGLRLVAARGRLMQAMDPGAMLAVELAEPELEPYCRDGLEVALLNAPSLTVLSGSVVAVDALERTLAAQGTQCRRLHTSHAFHSSAMEPMLDAFRERVRATPLRAPTIPFLSNLTGLWITAADATDPDYWVKQLRHTVRFADGVGELLRESRPVLLEVGPGRSLGTLVGRHPACTAEHQVLAALRHPSDARDDAACLLEAVGRLWTLGACRKPQGLYAHQSRRRVPLPTYPFERQRYWVEPPLKSTVQEAVTPPDAAPAGASVEDWFYVPAWRARPVAVLGDLADSGPWLLFLDEEGVGAALAERLRGAGQRVMTVAAGAAYADHGGGAYTLNPAQAADYDALLAGLDATGARPRLVVHLWSVAEPAANAWDRWDAAQQRGFHSLLSLVQALARRGWEEGLHLAVLSSHAQRVGDDAGLACPERATLLGVVRVAPLEYPGLRCRSIDLPAAAARNGGFSPDAVLAELLADPSAPVSALRGTTVWEEAYAAQRLPTPAHPPARLRAGGVYLITGGLGSMGQAMARRLAEEAKAKLVLIGRGRDVGRAGIPMPDASGEAMVSGCEAEPTLVSGMGTCPTYEALLDSLEADAYRRAALRDVDGEARLIHLLHGYCAGLIGRYFAENGIALVPGRRFSRMELRERLRVLPLFERFLDFLLRALAEDGVVALDGDTLQVLTGGTADVLDTLRAELLAEYPEFQGTVDLLAHCAARYAPALSGEIPSISVLYPDGTSKLLDDAGRGAPTYAGDGVHLDTAARWVAQLAEHAAEAGRTLRILEVGGGIGGLTRQILSALDGRRVDYQFTDLGQAFVLRAEREAAANGVDFMRFGQLDISRDPEAQGYAPHSFDLVLGYNVVHAAPDLGAAVQNLRGLLAPGGCMALVETTRLRRWDEMVWGLTEGWWHYTDGELRGGSPLLGPAAWEGLLQRQGFADVAVFPRDEAARRRADTCLVLGRQPVASEAVSASPARAHALEQDIRRLGGEVLTLAADLSDEGQLRAALEQARARFGAIHGVIHTAGVLGQGLIHGKTPDAVAEVFAAKAVGLLRLEKLLAEQGVEPDFLLLCASLASVAPIAGQVDYCAANAFLDAYAAHRSATGRTAAIAIDWGFWQALGMIEQAHMPDEWKRRIVAEIHGRGRAEAGVAAFRSILDACPPPQVLVAPDGLPEPLATVAGASQAARPTRFSKPSRPCPGPVDHPWFKECVAEAPGVETYIAHLDVGQWVLNEHRPLGQPQAVLPGTAYLELARAAWEAHHQARRSDFSSTRETNHPPCRSDFSPTFISRTEVRPTALVPVELNEVYFLAPLVVDDEETKEVRALLTPRPDGVIEFVVISRVESGVDEWLEHVRGEMAAPTVAPPPARDLADMRQRCGVESIDVAEGRHPFARRVGQFTPHWRVFERLGLGSGEALAELRLADEFAAEPARLPLHPALLDMATGFLSMVDGFEGGVPFYYQRVRVWQPLRAAVFSHARRAGHRQPGERRYDVTLLDEQGEVLVDVAGFTLREFGPARAVAAEAGTVPEEARNFCLEIERPGSLGTLSLRPEPRRPPGPGEVEIEVSAAGLNFIEVLYALAMLPEPPGGGVRFGLECAGTLTALGEGVTGFRVGDAVYGLAASAFSRYTLAAAHAIAPLPDNLSFAEAATLPAAFVTAYYSLMTRGRLRGGEKVLIHAASGGVGLAAVNIAEWRGADIFATAGTPAKREYLAGLGIRHVFDSRSLDFAGQVLDATGGRGVDLVLNSLGGEFIPAGLSVLARYGRFLELGKRDIFKDTPLGMAAFEKHLSFMAIDVGTELPEFPTIWRQVTRAVRLGRFRPLPYREFPINRVAEAFEHMAQGRHIGKVVVTIGPEAAAAVSAQRRRRGRPLADILGRGGVQPATDRGAKPSSTAPDRGLKPAPTMPAKSAAAGHGRPALATAYRAPSGDTELRVVAIWEELLGVSGLGVDDNFFELRGDSLLAAQVTSRLYEAFRVKLPLSSVFEQPTAAGLAARIERLVESLRALEATPGTTAGEGEVEQEL